MRTKKLTFYSLFLMFLAILPIFHTQARGKVVITLGG